MTKLHRMLARYIFILIGCLSLFWIGYASLDLIHKEESFEPTHLFGLEDKTVLIINRKKEVNLSALDFQTTASNQQLLQVLLPNLSDEKSIYISAKRSHILIDSRFRWTQQKTYQLAKKCGLTTTPKGLKKFQAGGYTFSFYKNHLYVYQNKYSTTKMDNWEKFDAKSSATFVAFHANSSAITEVYFKGDKTVEYKSRNAIFSNVSKVDDQGIFSEVLPIAIESYHFLEKKYAAHSDKTYRKGPMYSWQNNGFVAVEYKGETVLISDFIPGQEPIQILYDYTKREAENTGYAQFSAIRLTENFPKKGSNSFYIYALNDFVVISENQGICEEIVTQNKLGNTLASVPSALKNTYSGLPRLVSERKVNQLEKFSKTGYNQTLLETHLPQNKTTAPQKQPQGITSIAMNADGYIQDFLVLAGKGNCLIENDDGQLAYFSNEKRAWKTNVSGKPIGDMQFSKSLGAFILTRSSTVYLIDKSGNQLHGSPIELKGSSPVQQAHYFEWKGKKQLVYPTENGEVILVDLAKKTRTVLPVKLDKVTVPIESWVSQNKLFLGVLNNKQFKMIDLDKKREFRSFSVPNNARLVHQSNGIHIIGADNNQLVTIDQKGKKKIVAPLAGSAIELVHTSEGDVFVWSEQRGQLSLYSLTGEKIGQLTNPVSNVEFQSATMLNGLAYYTFIDGIENNVDVRDGDGKKVSPQKIEGSRKSVLSQEGNHLLVTTIVDTYLLQYLLQKQP